ncbi:MAG: molybdopterin-synthase adenylyltransferase MoeB [Gemmatimonadetes bacterium]|nr:MAG: molybdopterin-synthase adenylyltransferase MoeB [Gemmatimonadota bacterium]
MIQSDLSRPEIARYSRHLLIPEVGLVGQQRLKAARVLVVGAGGLGCPALLYLAAAGVGTLGIVDFDVVDESNLQRQVLYTVADVGQPKAECAAKRLTALNPYVTVEVHRLYLTSENVLPILKSYDLVVDGTDNFPTRYLLNDAAVLLDKPLVYGSIYRFEGQVSVFNYQNCPNYRDLYPEPPPPELVPNCAEGGVLGVLAGIIGSIQANEAIKIITGIGEPLAGRLFLFDALRFESQIMHLPRHTPPIHIETLIDYNQFCGVKKEDDIPELTVTEFNQLRHRNTDFQLIDVRQPYEREIVHIGGELIPQNEIFDRLEELSRSKMLIIYCRSGKRSATVVKQLRSLGFDNARNLKGGVLAYREEIDPSLAKY